MAGYQSAVFYERVRHRNDGDANQNFQPIAFQRMVKLVLVN